MPGNLYHQAWEVVPSEDKDEEELFASHFLQFRQGANSVPIPALYECAESFLIFAG
jgi:hypothetical protein